MSNETKTNEPVKQEGDFKIKSKKKTPKNLGHLSKNDVAKVDLTKPSSQGEVVPDVIKVEVPKEEINKEDNAIKEPSTESVDENKPSGDVQEVGETHTEKQEASEESPIQEIKEEDIVKEEIQKEIIEKPQAVLPENIEKLVKFMEDTGGTIEDYTRLNYDYSKIDDNTLIKEYYKNIKPHLNSEEIDFLLEDKFKYDEELDEPRDIKKKKLALKEEIAEARKGLEQMKKDYYQEIKLRPGDSSSKAVEFYNNYAEQQKLLEKQQEEFKNKTTSLFSNDFKGFDFNLGEKKFRYKIQDPSKVAKTQQSLENFASKYIDNEGNLANPSGYHKALYAAMNVDKIANHFYEQGKADGIKNVVNSSKNLSTENPRQVADGNVFINGLKVKSISGLDTSKLKIKTKKFN